MGYTLEEALSCVGPGWSDLVKSAYSLLTEETEVTQVKEKSGVLRIYISTGDVWLFNQIDEIENKSQHICEECGREKDGVILKNHWYHSLCNECLVATRDGKLFYGGV